MAEAQKVVRTQLNENARTFIARAGARYAGEVIGETDLHTLQKIVKDSAVAHFTSKFDQRLSVCERASVTYDQDGNAHVQHEVERGPHADAAHACVVIRPER